MFFHHGQFGLTRRLDEIAYELHQLHEPSWHFWAASILTLGVAIGTVGLAISTAKMARGVRDQVGVESDTLEELRKQVRVESESLAESTRPILVRVGDGRAPFEVEQTGVPAEHFMETSGHSNDPFLIVPLRNIGRGPAIDIWAVVRTPDQEVFTNVEGRNVPPLLGYIAEKETENLILSWRNGAGALEHADVFVRYHDLRGQWRHTLIEYRHHSEPKLRSTTYRFGDGFGVPSDRIMPNWS